MYICIRYFKGLILKERNIGKGLCLNNTNKNPLISIIVPIYNVEKYIRQCIENIRCQTYKDLEIILVDDGSPDNCGKICDEYAKLDDRVIVIHKENGGLSSARNAGIDIATGDYLGFVDGDDWIKSDMYESMLKNILNNEADISVCGFYLSFVNLNIPNYNKKELLLLTPEQAIKECLNGIKFNVSAWDKLYKKSIFDEIRYPEGKIYEDAYVIVEILDKCKKVVVDTEPKYYYRQRSGSILQSKYNSRLIDLIDAFNNNLAIVKRKYPSVIDIAKIRLLRGNFEILHRIVDCKNFKKFPEYKKTKKFLRENIIFIIKCELLTTNEKIKAFILQINISLYKAFRDLNLKRQRRCEGILFE